MAVSKKDLSLKVSSSSSIAKFIDWYGDAYSTKSKMGRVMKGKSAVFLQSLLDGVLEGSIDKKTNDIVKEFQLLKTKTPEEIWAEKTFKDAPEKLKKWSELQQDIEEAKKRAS
tara:strand:+ start:145 stop:483 length:339 start_codon:yes stop_codon:yes gene_type:complete